MLTNLCRDAIDVKGPKAYLKRMKCHKWESLKWKYLMFGELILWALFQVLLETNYVCKWVEAISLPKNDTKSMKNIFARFGTPRSLVSDEKSHFCNKQFEMALAKYSVRHRITTTYHPYVSLQIGVWKKLPFANRVGKEAYESIKKIELRT
ncbi:Pol polyprotein [Gossypium australe]|uniref:Pol polyprotein n=1 Tax=Gossypium australe TaxID=47621 RepID=A0A5B6X0B0_9ROSI|nr:Pol polyprotein [Gossypium australe]